MYASFTSLDFPEEEPSGRRKGSGGRKDAVCCASGFEHDVRSRWRGCLCAVACSFNHARANRHKHIRALDERAVRGQSHEEIEGPSGLLFRERRSVQQGGEERMEIAGAGE